jgi:hypothetical protein
VSAQHQRSATLWPFHDADYVRPTWSRHLDLHIEAEAAHVGGNRVSDRRFAAGAGYQRRIDRINRDKIAEKRKARVHG